MMPGRKAQAKGQAFAGELRYAAATQMDADDSAMGPSSAAAMSLEAPLRAVHNFFPREALYPYSMANQSANCSRFLKLVLRSSLMWPISWIRTLFR